MTVTRGHASRAQDQAGAATEGAEIASKVSRRDPDATRANIIEVATREFAENGLDGARVDEIAEKTRTSKRMIYYYFESKEGLHVLENVYREIQRGSGWAWTNSPRKGAGLVEQNRM